MAEEQSWRVGVAGQMRRLSVAIDHDTDDYNRANALLPWYIRTVARSSLTILYSIPPSVLSVLFFHGLYAAVDAVSNANSSDLGTRMGVWFIVDLITLEVSTGIMRTELDPAYIQRKPLMWMIFAVVWSVSLVVSGGNLGMWAFGVWWLGYWVAILMEHWFWLGEPMLDALWEATMYSSVFLLCALSISGYIYVLSTVSGVPMMVVTGGIYPLLACGLKEVLFQVLSEKADKDAGLSENDDVEKGTFIAIVVVAEAGLELVNKIAIAQITSVNEFAGTMALSFVIDILGKAAVLWWHRNKEVVKNTARTASTVVPYRLSSSVASSEGRESGVESSGIQKIRSFNKAAHRHENANDKKRYEFRTYYGELGESVATMVAFGTLISTGELQPAEGLARLAFAIVCEYFSDLGVWVMMESDGYNLTNVVYRFHPTRIGALVFIVAVGLATVQLGNEMAAMAMVNATAVNGTVGNLTSNGTTNATQ